MTNNEIKEANKYGLFSLGRVVITACAAEGLLCKDVYASLRRHRHGDWGVLSDGDRKENDEALANNGRLISSYIGSTGVKFWIITEGDRSATTVLLPNEY